MRRALVDNATLTAVQRLNGEIKVKNRFDLDGDILAMEGLLQAVLFFDEVMYLDDYKKEFREKRAKYFSGLRPVPLDEQTSRLFSQETQKLMEQIVPEVMGGSFTDGNFRPFFDMLKMHLWYVWNVQSSVFYLTQKLLACESGMELNKYSALSAMIYSEFKDKEQEKAILEKKAVLLDSDGRPIENRENVTLQAETFFAGLNWMAYRTLYYTLAASQFGLNLFLHPIRQAFQVNFLKQNNIVNAGMYKPLIEALTGTASDTMARIYSVVNPAVVSCPIPIFSAYLAAKSSKAGIGLLDCAYHLREEGMFIEARRQFDRLEQFYKQQKGARFLKEANRLQKELTIQMRRILEKYQVTNPQGSLTTNMISLWDAAGLAAGLPNLGGSAGIEHIVAMLHNNRPAAGLNAVYKSILSDLINIQMLGSFHEMITRNVWYDKDADYRHIKEQDPGYKRAHSWWSRPM